MPTARSIATMATTATPKTVHLVVSKFALFASDNATRLAARARHDLNRLGDVAVTVVPAGDEIYVIACPKDQSHLERIQWWIAGLEAGRAL